MGSRPFAYPLILVAGFLLFFPNLGGHALWEEDEAHNAQCAKEMAEADTWVTPTFNYRLRTDKPVLQYWAIRWSYLAFGENEWSARLPSALAGLLALLLCYELGRGLFDPLTGLASAFTLGGCFMFNVAAHAVTPDAFLVAATLAAFAAFAVDYRRGSSNWLLTASAASGFAVLAKGPVGVALPLLIVGSFLLWQRQLSLLWNRRLIGGAALFAAVAAPWYVLVGMETRLEFLRGFIFRHNLNRFGATMEGHGGGLWFHPLSLFVAFAPPSVFLALSAWAAWRGETPPADADERSVGKLLSPAGPQSWPYRFLACWSILWIGFFSLAATKLPNYLLPMYPALAVLVGRFLVRWGRGDLVLSPWIAHTALACLALVGVALGIGLMAASGALPGIDLKGRAMPTLLPLAAVGLALVVLAGLASRWHRQNHTGWAAGTVIVAGCLAVGLLGAFGPTLADQARAPKQLAARLNAEGVVGDALVGCHLRYHPSLVFYTNRQVRRSLDDQKAVELLNCPWPAFLVVAARDWPRLRPQVPERCAVVARAFEVSAGDHLLLVFNRGECSFQTEPLAAADDRRTAADPRQHGRPD